MTDHEPPVDEIDTDALEAAHETIELSLPRWVADLLIGTAEVVADAEEASDALRRDCEAAAGIARSRLPDDPREE